MLYFFIAFLFLLYILIINLIPKSEWPKFNYITFYISIGIAAFFGTIGFVEVFFNVA